MQIKRTENAEYNIFKMAISDFPRNDSVPKNEINWHCYIFLLKCKISQTFEKRNICCITISGHMAYNILGWYIRFRQTYSPKTVFVDDVIFQTANLSISRHRKDIKMTFLESWEQTGSETRIFIRKCQSENLTFIWPEVNQTILYRWLA